MKKFSKVQRVDILGVKDAEYVYDGYLKVKSANGYEYVVENDCAIAIVHLLDFNEILLRKEFIPPFQEIQPTQEFFLTCLSGTIENGETPYKTVIRELVEEAGILLNSTYTNQELIGDYFFNKANTAKAHIYYIPLRINDYRKVSATGDGSKLEDVSTTVRVDVKFLNSLKPSDILTAFVIEKMKEKVK